VVQVFVGVSVQLFEQLFTASTLQLIDSALQFAEQPALYSYEQSSASTMVFARAADDSIVAAPNAPAPSSQ
jgi:hypothetical protein